MKAVLIRKSTQEVIKKAMYPREDMQPVIGLNPDMEWLIVREVNSIPIYDPRVYVLIKSEQITKVKDTEYPHLNQYQVTYSTEKRDITSITQNVTQLESDYNQQIIPYEKQLKLLTLGVGILFKYSKSTLTEKEQLIKDRLISIAIKIWKNDQTLRDKISAILANKLVDLDTNWEKEE